MCRSPRLAARDRPAGRGIAGTHISRPSAGLCRRQAAETGDLDVVRSVLSLVPKDLDEATGRALSTCNYANVLGEAFGCGSLL